MVLDGQMVLNGIEFGGIIQRSEVDGCPTWKSFRVFRACVREVWFPGGIRSQNWCQVFLFFLQGVGESVLPRSLVRAS